MFLLMVWTDSSCDKDADFQCKYLYQCIPLNQVDSGTEQCFDRTDEGLLIVLFTDVNTLLLLLSILWWLLYVLYS